MKVRPPLANIFLTFQPYPDENYKASILSSDLRCGSSKNGIKQIEFFPRARKKSRAEDRQVTSRAVGRWGETFIMKNGLESYSNKIKF